MDGLSHLALGLLLAEALALPSSLYASFALGSILPDLDAASNLLKLPIHRTLLHDPFLWLVVLVVARKKPTIKYLSLGALLHCFADAFFGVVPLLPLPYMFGVEAYAKASSGGIEVVFRVLLENLRGGYATGYAFNGYGLVLFSSWLALRLAKRFA